MRADPARHSTQAHRQPQHSTAGSLSIPGGSYSTVVLIAELQDRVRSLEEANRENRRIIAALTSRILAIEAPTEAPGSPETAMDEAESAAWTAPSLGGPLVAQLQSHPIFSGTGNNLAFIAPPPEGLSATGPGNYLEVRFTATDSTGLSKTTTREVQPNRVNLAFGSNPSGLWLQADDQAFAAPKTLISWEGYKLQVSASSPQTLGGTSYEFASWSDGGTQSHDITAPDAATTYTATYTATSATSCTIIGTSAVDTLTGTSGDDVICGGRGGDTIKGGGNDILRGQGGADKLYGEDGDDTFDGGPGTDAANFSSSLVAVTASLADNTATGEGSDTLTGIR